MEKEMEGHPQLGLERNTRTSAQTATVKIIGVRMIALIFKKNVKCSCYNVDEKVDTKLYRWAPINIKEKKNWQARQPNYHDSCLIEALYLFFPPLYFP